MRHQHRVAAAGPHAAPPSPGTRLAYTLGEEIANSVTHGLGLLLAVVGLVVLVQRALPSGDPWRVVSVAVYGVTLVLLYGVSTLYHALPSPRAKVVLRVCDHACIYLLIAGTYTPFTLVTLRGPWGWGLFATVWGLAALGVAFKLFFTGRFQFLSVAFYVAMGWCIVVAIGPLRAALHPNGVMLVVGGGVAYTLGALFYALVRRPYGHAVWHVFVLTGSVLHFFAVLLYVVP